ncbi:hypothetical protein NW752_005907 [Fusarium irregulare]|nr:hypothetical protein NW752_005907 [Fusarium irregulare]
MDPYSRTSELVDISRFDTQGLCAEYQLRRHKFEDLADAGCHQARSDWIKYVGPVNEFGGCNHINGNFSAVVLPLCKPDRLELVAYVLEYAFLHDSVLEAEDTSPEAAKQAKAGIRHIHEKIMGRLLQTDEVCAKRIEKVWKEMIATTMRDKRVDFQSIEDYLEFRMVDTGAPFVEAIMLFGMGMTLTPQEDEELRRIIRPCFAALALTNDYFSFDREIEEEETSVLINSVAIVMRLQNLDIPSAKVVIKDIIRKYEKEFMRQIDEYKQQKGSVPEKIERYMEAMSYQIVTITKMSALRFSQPLLRRAALRTANTTTRRFLNTESAPTLYSAHAKAIGARKGRIEGENLNVELTMAKALGGPGDKGKTNPEELFAAGYGACFQSAMNACAAQMGITMPTNIEDSVVDTTVHLVGDMKQLDMSLRVDMKIKVKGLAKDELEKVVEKAKEVCPYSRATKGNVATNFEYVQE